MDQETKERLVTLREKFRDWQEKPSSIDDQEHRAFFEWASNPSGVPSAIADRFQNHSDYKTPAIQAFLAEIREAGAPSPQPQQGGAQGKRGMAAAGGGGGMGWGSWVALGAAGGAAWWLWKKANE